MSLGLRECGDSTFCRRNLRPQVRSILSHTSLVFQPRHHLSIALSSDTLLLFLLRIENEVAPTLDEVDLSLERTGSLERIQFQREPIRQNVSTAAAQPQRWHAV